MAGEDYGAFPATRWTLIGRAGVSEKTTGFVALEELLRRYRPALLAHLVAIKKITPDRADDLVQGFVESKILTGELLRQADAKRGRFRTLLLTALDRHVVSVIRGEQAQKRSPGEGKLVDIDDLHEAIPTDAKASSEFDVAWAREMIAETLRRVRTTLETSGRLTYWDIFDARVVAPILDGTEPEAYGGLIERLGFKSPTQASNALVTAKRVFARTMREVVAEYATTDEEIDRELRDLKAILSGAVARS